MTDQLDRSPEPWERSRFVPDTRKLSVPEVLRAVVDAQPDHVAFVADDRSWTYSELDAATNRIAHALLAHGSPGDPVSVVAAHGATPVLAIVGALKAGFVASPLDARDPNARVEELHAVLGSRAVITDRAHVGAANALSGVDATIVLDALPGDDSASGVTPRHDDPAVVYFTSGSTGRPKGVVHSHAGLVNVAQQFHALVGTTPDDRIAITGTYSYAGTTNRAFGAILHGASALAFDVRDRGVSDLPDWMNQQGITVASFVPSVLRALCADPTRAPMTSVRWVLLAGDVLFGHDIALARPRFGPSTVFVNRFASAETFLVAASTIGPDDPIPPGAVPLVPSPWNDLLLEDEHGNRVASGERGRLVAVGGVPALGYWRDEAATAARFFTAPDGRRGVRLDDVALVRPDGLVEHVGRWDDRVKIRGALVHPGEVERALASIAGVADAAVLAQSLSGGEARLVAYVAPSPAAELRPWELRRELAATLPTTMVPSAVVLLDALPRGARGKLDRSALPRPERALANEDEVPISTRTRDMARLFGEVLGVDDVGATEDFFDLGGDSLAALELAEAVAELFGVELEIGTLLDAPTPQLLVEQMVRRRARGASPLLVVRAAASGVPFVCVAGGGSHALALRPLAYALDERPVYGLQARGLEERARADHRVETSARRYVDAVRGRISTTNLVLGGHSFGGTVAFEMARQLEATDSRPALLVLLDTAAPIDVGLRRSVRARVEARIEREPPTRGRLGTVGTVVKVTGNSAVRRSQRAIALQSAGLMPRRGSEQYELFYRVSQAMSRRYRPTSTYDGRVLIVRALDADARDDPRRAADDLGWSSLLSGRVEVVDLPGDHNGIIRPPAVAAVGRVVERAIADAIVGPADRAGTSDPAA